MRILHFSYKAAISNLAARVFWAVMGAKLSAFLHSARWAV